MADKKTTDIKNLILSEAQTKDATAISFLVNSAYRGESSRKGWTTEADLLGGQRTNPSLIESELADPNKKIICIRAADSQKILACVSLEKIVEDNEVSCYFSMLTVNPELQAGGIGRFLLTGAEDIARQWGASRMTMSVIQQRTELVAWYERRGYVRTGKTEPFPYGDEDFGKPNRPDLMFLLFEKRL